MFCENTDRWLLLFVFYCEFVCGLDSGHTIYTTCKTENDCIPAKNCEDFTILVESLGRPLKPPVIDFLRARHCGFHEGYPKVCCSDFSRQNASPIESQRTDCNKCSPKDECISLIKCKPYMDFIGTTEKPLQPPIEKFLRAQQCGFQEGYPMVCCSLNLLTNLKVVKHTKSVSQTHKKSNKLSVTEMDLREVFNNNQDTTPKPLGTISDKRKKEKAAAINMMFYMDPFFVLTEPFDLVRRKRFDNSEFTLNVEIR